MTRFHEPVALAVVGTGNRGADAYGRWCLDHPEQARVVAVADPDPARRERMADQHGIPSAHRYRDWAQLLSEPRAVDGVVIATPDHAHVGPATLALSQGYDLLLEKPIARSAPEVLELERVARQSSSSVTVAHVLRYTPFFSTIRRLIVEGRVGQLATIQHTENIGFWHFAHSYVRGSWRSQATSSPMILAKASHDLDVVRWLADAPCTGISSFGSLLHFRPENAPDGAPERCIAGCPVGDACPYNAERFYLNTLRDWHGAPVTILTTDTSREGRVRALWEQPYGRCVYRHDNDVVDHQVVAARFDNDVTATITVSAFTEENTRTIKVMGSAGELRGHMDSGEIEIRSFSPLAPTDPQAVDRTSTAIGGAREVVRVPEDATRSVPGAFSDHAGGDAGLMRAFVEHLRLRREGQPTAASAAMTTLDVSIESHLMAFAAEKSRLTGRVIDLRSEHLGTLRHPG